jgi:hypothetical protein
MDQPPDFDFVYHCTDEANAGQRSNEAPFQGVIAADPGCYYPHEPHYPVDLIAGPSYFVQPWDARYGSAVLFPFVPPVLDQQFNPPSFTTSTPYGGTSLTSGAFGSNIALPQVSHSCILYACF